MTGLALLKRGVSTPLLVSPEQLFLDSELPHMLILGSNSLDHTHSHPWMNTRRRCGPVDKRSQAGDLTKWDEMGQW